MASSGEPRRIRQPLLIAIDYSDYAQETIVLSEGLCEFLARFPTSSFPPRPGETDRVNLADLIKSHRSLLTGLDPWLSPWGWRKGLIPKVEEVPQRRRVWKVPGTIFDLQVEAIPDTGSRFNIISDTLARRLSTPIDTSTQTQLRLPNNSTCQTRGTINLPFKFAGESASHDTLFHVVKGAVNDLLFGSTFLKATSTLKSAFRHRIKEVWEPLRYLPNVRLIDQPSEWLFGALGGEFVAAVPDTGCDALLMSKRYAFERGFEMHTSHGTRKAFELADGSILTTCGMVKDCVWQFGDERVQARGQALDFYVVEDLPVDVILSNDFLFDTDAYNAHERAFIQLAPHADGTDDNLFWIREIAFYEKKRAEISEESQGAPNLERQLLDAEVTAELRRRSSENNRIRGLTESAKADAVRKEDLRRKAWETIFYAQPAVSLHEHHHDPASSLEAAHTPSSSSAESSNPRRPSVSGNTLESQPVSIRKRSFLVRLLRMK